MTTQCIKSILPAVTLFNELVITQLNKLVKMDSKNELYENKLAVEVIKLLPSVVSYFKKVDFEIIPLSKMMDPSLSHYHKTISASREELIIKLNRLFIGLSINDLPDSSITRILKIYDTLFNMDNDIKTVLNESDLINNILSEK